MIHKDFHHLNTHRPTLKAIQQQAVPN